MKKYTSFRSILIVFFTLIFTTSGISQESLYKVSMSQQIEESSFVIEGKVLSNYSFWDDNQLNIYTSHTVVVYKVFKGQPEETIEVITKGGIVDLEAEVVSNSLKLNEGDLGVFILSKNSENLNTRLNGFNRYQSTNANQGFYKYNLEYDIAINPLSSIAGITTNLYNSISSLSQQTVLEISQFDVSKRIQELSRLNSTTRNSNPASVISSFTTSDNSAGTRSVLTINGNNFGANQGAIGFSDANFGGALFTEALDSQILSWTNTQIEVEIPGHAGTGTIRVYTIGNGSITSVNELTIDYAQTNLVYDLGSGNVAYQTQHIDNNSNGGNTWEMNLDFSNSFAKTPFENALETWSCQSSVNWSISNNTTTNSTIADDNQNLITFNNLSSGILGQCISRYSGCLVDGEIRWYVEEIDMVFNSNINWNFSTNPPSLGEIDFETVAVHELGHGQQLGHVIDNDLIMHYSLSGGNAQRQLSPEDLMGAEDIMSRSTSTTICNQPSMTPSSCFNNLLSTNDFDLSEHITIFPNPATENVLIKSASGVTIENINIYNVEGKQVLKIKENGSRLTNVSVSSLPSGMYFVQLTTNSGVISQKLIIN